MHRRGMQRAVRRAKQYRKSTTSECILPQFTTTSRLLYAMPSFSGAGFSMNFPPGDLTWETTVPLRVVGGQRMDSALECTRTMLRGFRLGGRWGIRDNVLTVRCTRFPSSGLYRRNNVVVVGKRIRNRGDTTGDKIQHVIEG